MLRSTAASLLSPAAAAAAGQLGPRQQLCPRTAEGRAEDVVRDRTGLLLRCLSTDEKVKYFWLKCNIFIIIS